MSEEGVPGVTVAEVSEEQQTVPRKMVLNMGPQHPSTHGVLRLLIELDGEIITRCQPDIGFLHTGIEKECEVKSYQQAVTLTVPLPSMSPHICAATGSATRSESSVVRTSERMETSGEVG